MDNTEKNSENLEDATVSDSINPEQKLVNDYKSAAQEINDMLKKIGLPLESFSREFQDKVKSIGELAAILNVKDPSETSLLFGISALENLKMKFAEQENFQVHIMSKLTRRMNMVAKLNQELQKNMEDKEKIMQKLEPQQSKLANNIKYLEGKCDRYAAFENQLQNSLNETGVVPELYHGNLVKDDKELQRLKKELKALTSKLESYKGLPPDEQLAKLELEKAHAELFQIEKEFEAQSIYHFGVSESPDAFM